MFFRVFGENVNNLRKIKKEKHSGKFMLSFFCLLERSLVLNFEVWKFTFCVYFCILISFILVNYGVLRCCWSLWSRNNQILSLFFSNKDNQRVWLKITMFFHLWKKKYSPIPFFMVNRFPDFAHFFPTPKLTYFFWGGKAQVQ